MPMVKVVVVVGGGGRGADAPVIAFGRSKTQLNASLKTVALAPPSTPRWTAAARVVNFYRVLPHGWH